MLHANLSPRNGFKRMFTVRRVQSSVVSYSKSVVRYGSTAEVLARLIHICISPKTGCPNARMGCWKGAIDGGQRASACLKRAARSVHRRLSREHDQPAHFRIHLNF